MFVLSFGLGFGYFGWSVGRSVGRLGFILVMVLMIFYLDTISIPQVGLELEFSPCLLHAEIIGMHHQAWPPMLASEAHKDIAYFEIIHWVSKNQYPSKRKVSSNIPKVILEFFSQDVSCDVTDMLLLNHHLEFLFPFFLFPFPLSV